MTASHAAGYRQRLFRTGANDSLPISLHHQRIYILPTRLGLAMIAVVMLMLVASVNYRLSLGYALSFILTGLFASCLLNTYRNLSGIQLRKITTKDCFAPGPQAFFIEAGCQCNRRRYSIEIASNTDKDVFDIKPNGIAVASLKSSGVSRGQHMLGRLTVASSFPLGLWRAWAYIHVPAGGFVYPAPEFPTPAFPTAAASAGETAELRTDRSNRAAQSGDYDSLRNWQRSDSPASVAWKAVARGNGWYSKDFASATIDESLLLQWDELPTSMTLEQRLSRLCAWVLEAQSQSKVCRVVMPGIGSITLPCGQTPRLLRHLATVEAPTDEQR